MRSIANDLVSTDLLVIRNGNNRYSDTGVDKVPIRGWSTDGHSICGMEDPWMAIANSRDYCYFDIIMGTVHGST